MKARYLNIFILMIVILVVAIGILAFPARAEPEYGITYEPEIICVGDTVHFHLSFAWSGELWVKWCFGDGTCTGAVWKGWHITHIYEEEGTYLVTGKIGSQVYDTTITVWPKILDATIDIDPDTLFLESNGKWITAYIELPEYDASNIDVSTIILNDQVSAEARPTEIGDYDADGISDLMVKFDRSAVQDILELGEEVEITITGSLTDGTPFEGSDTLKVIEKKGKKEEGEKGLNVQIEYLNPVVYLEEGTPVFLINGPLNYQLSITNNGGQLKNLEVTAIQEYGQSGTCNRYWYPYPLVVDFTKGQPLPGDSVQVWENIDLAPGETKVIVSSYTIPLEACSSLGQTHVIIKHIKGHSSTAGVIYDESEAGVFYLKAPGRRRR